jgi:uncharacterized protein (DUF433 family)
VLACESDFDGAGATVPYGVYGAVVEVDTDTGGVVLSRLVTVDDAGTVLNPLLALGQVHGGLAQAVGQALFEEFSYDDDGNPLTATFLDYLLPSTADLPSFESHLTQHPSPHNPLGFRSGCGRPSAGRRPRCNGSTTLNYMVKSEPFSLRLSSTLEAMVNEEARRTSRSKGAVLAALAEEALKARRFPGIAFRGVDWDRRAWVIGTALDVWEIVAAYQDFESVEAMTKETDLTERQIRIALAFYERFPGEIDEALDRNRRSLDELRAEYPTIDVVIDRAR